MSSFTGSGAWTCDSFSQASEWVYHFRPETLAEIDGFVRRRRRKPGSATPDDQWVLPSLESDLLRLRDELLTGRGFVLLKGLPLDR